MRRWHKVLSSPSTAKLEKVFQQGLGLIRANAVIDFRNMMALGMVKNARTLCDAARFRVSRAIIEPRDAGLADGACTHRARFECYV